MRVQRTPPAHARSTQAGFSTLELLIAVAIALVAGFALLKIIAGFNRVMVASYTAPSGADAIAKLESEMRNEAATAFAVFVPANDVLGAPNAAPGAAGHEVDFYSKGNGGTPLFWAYYYDAGAHTVRRYDYDPNGNRGVRDPASGRIVASASYPAISNVSQFAAKRLYSSDLATGANPYAGSLAGLSATPQPLPVSFNNASLNRPDLYGGDTMVQVQIAGGTVSRVVHLMSGALPTGFTYEGTPAWHAVLYRVDTSHRSFFGLISQTAVYIYGEVDVTYDAWKSAPIPWCKRIPIYGSGGGLQSHDPHADYVPDDPSEQANRLLRDCTQGIVSGSLVYPAHPTPPPSTYVDTSGPVTPPPDVIDTPPPCWSDPGPGGRCWPAEAPPNWAPSPLPSDTPPPSWCATHQQSAACA